MAVDRDEERSLRVQRPRWIGYTVTVLLEAALTLGLVLLSRVFPLADFPIPYVLLTMVIAYLFGEGPAVLSIVLGWFLFTYYAVPPRGIVWPPANTLKDWAGQVAFLLGVILVAVATIQARKSRQRIQGLADEATSLNVSLRDEISERKQAEESLRESEERFRLMADAIPQLAWMADPDGYIFWYNQRWYEYTGTTPEQMEGWGWQRVHDPQMLPKVLEKWKASISTGQSFEMDFPLRRSDGQFRWFLTRVIPMKDPEGRVARWFGTNTDINEKREAAEEIRKLNAELEQRVAQRTAELETSNKELEAFSYSVSHDLRAPLRAIDGFSNALLKNYSDKLDERGDDYLHRVRAAAQRMAQLIDDILGLSRATRTEMHLQRVDLSEMAKEILGEFKKSQPERHVEIEVTQGLIVDADSHLLRIAINNLLDNAWKFSSKRDVAYIEVGAIEQNGERVYYVKDNGAGFNPTYADKLFSAFQRLHAENEFPGTGIGLALVQRIIRRHRGRVWAESAVDQGATVYFTLGEASK